MDHFLLRFSRDRESRQCLPWDIQDHLAMAQPFKNWHHQIPPDTTWQHQNHLTPLCTTYHHLVSGTFSCYSSPKSRDASETRFANKIKRYIEKITFRNFSHLDLAWNFFFGSRNFFWYTALWSVFCLFLKQGSTLTKTPYPPLPYIFWTLWTCSSWDMEPSNICHTYKFFLSKLRFLDPSKQWFWGSEVQIT